MKKIVFHYFVNDFTLFSQEKSFFSMNLANGQD